MLGGIFSLTLFFGANLIAKILCNPSLSVNLRVFSIVPFVMLPTMGLEGILATYRRTKLLAIYSVLTRLMMLLCVVVPVLLFDTGCTEALIGFSAASVFSFVIALYLKNYPLRGQVVHSCGIRYKEILQFAIPLFWASIWGMLIASADQFFVSRFWGTEAFAEFSCGFMEIPFIGMITGACATVLSPIFSKATVNGLSNLKQTLYPVWLSVFKKTILLIYPILLFCWFFSDVVMVFLYGEQYVGSSVYFRWKVLGSFFTVMVYGPLLINIGKARVYSWVHLAGAIVLILLEWLAGLFFQLQSPSVIAMISVVCLLGRIFCMLAIVARCFEVKVYQLFPLREICRIVLIASAVLLGLRYLLVECIDMDYMLLLPLSLVLYAVIYLVLAKFLKIDYYSIIKPFFQKSEKV